MFDDQNQKTPGGPPPNLPITEPEDMFAAVESAESSFPSALEAGALRRKADMPDPPRITVAPQEMREDPLPSEPPSQPPMQPNPPVAHELYDIRGPGIGKWIQMSIIMIVVLAVLGGGGWFVYTRFIAPPDPGTSPTTRTPTVPAFSQDTTSSFNQGTPSAQNDDTISSDTGVSLDNLDSQVLFGEPVDQDADGLEDDKEQEGNTDPLNWDTDGDALSDGDEVLIWKTDPLNPDTDGDTYQDGTEVKSGYSPAGPGKIFEPPTTNTSTSAQ